MKLEDEELLQKQRDEAAARLGDQRKAEEDRKVSMLRGINGGVVGQPALSPEMQNWLAHTRAQNESADLHARMFVLRCKELVELGATEVCMYGCSAKFERKP